jgi:hypothetical protein
VLTGEEYFVILKLTSGEQVMSALQDEDEQFVQLLHPMVVRTIPNFQTGREQVTVAPLCAFSSDEEYIIDKRNVMYIKELSETYVSHYINVVKEHSQVKFTPRESIEHDSEEEDEPFNFVEGNDTKH